MSDNCTLKENQTICAIIFNCHCGTTAISQYYPYHATKDSVLIIQIRRKIEG
jgi:hypothetical protein